jgi:hypothetical protein
VSITKEQAKELADKYLSYTGKVALRDNILVVNKDAKGWIITAKTTPIILGMDTEVCNFSINAETGEVGVSIDYVLKQIDEMKDIDNLKKEQAKAKVIEVDKELREPINKNKLNSLKIWLKDNAPYLKSIIDLIATILSKLP